MSLNDAPSGDDRLRIGRTLVASSLAINMFTLKSSIGEVSNGPQTSPFLTYVAMVSVMISPLCMADLAFLL